MNKNRIKNLIELMEDYISGGLLFVGVTLIFIGVVSRYILNAPIAWIDEISKYTIIWGVLIGCSVALRDNHHIKVDMLYNKLPKAAKRIVSFVSNTLGLLYCIFLSYYGWKLVEFKMKTGQTSMDVGVPMWIVYLILPLTGLLMGTRFIFMLYFVAKGDVQEEVNGIDPAAL